MSAKVQKGRVSRKEQRRLEALQAQRRRNLLVGIPLAILVVVLVGVVAASVFQPGIEGVAQFSGVQRAHDVGAKFPAGGLPPVGGIHPPSWQTCGIYDVPVDTGLAVHSMEHGAVWISYHPDVPAGEVALLEEHAGDDAFVLMSPYPDQDSEIVLTAWSVQLPLDSAEDERIPEFISRYRNKGPEPGVTCQNGVGVPTG